jgi:DNA-directed RNA polymerase subunit RPC12/RpoP
MSELKLYVCIDCSKVVKSVSGLTRHTTMMHLREPLTEEKEPV